jgi:hypothetical protein
MSLELIRVVNQETKEEGGDVEPENGEALISAF